jgi:hypothetical protein
MVDVKRINRDRLSSWEKQLTGSHATPFILVGVGHDHVSGQLVVCTTEDRSNTDIILTLQAVIAELQKG